MFEHTVPASWFPRCAIFDCDGVLLDSETAWNRVQRELFNRWNIPFSDDLEEQLPGFPRIRLQKRSRVSHTPATLTTPRNTPNISTIRSLNLRASKQILSTPV